MTSRSADNPKTAGRRLPPDAGLTVLELMVVLVILSLIGVVVGVQVFQQLDRARVDVARLQLRQLQNGLTLFQLDMRRFPTADEGLSVLIDAPRGQASGWRGPYIRNDDVLLDPWGSEIGYEVKGASYTLTSLGADRKPGGDGAAAEIVLTEND